MSHVFHRHAHEATGAAQATPELVATVYPASVATSSDPDDPIQAQLRLTITSVSSDPLTLDPGQGDRLIVYFPWGDGPGDLTAQPTTIDVEAPPGWQATRMPSSSQIGPYWQLDPNATLTLSQHDAVAFLFTGIVAQGPASATVLYLQSEIGGVQGPQIAVPLPKETPLRIRSFTATPSKVLPGQNVTLAWATDGAVSGTIDPGNIAADSSPGSTQVPVSADTRFTLTATAIDGTSLTASARANVYAAGWTDWSTALPAQAGSGLAMLAPLAGGYALVTSTVFTESAEDGTPPTYDTTSNWSEDCRQWTEIKGAPTPPYKWWPGLPPWTAGTEELVVVQFDALPAGSGLYRTVDGATWSALSASLPASISAGETFSTVVIYAGDVYLFGTTQDSTAAWAWRCTGSTWEQCSKTAAWGSCSYLAATVFDEQIWVLAVAPPGDGPTAYCWSWEGGDANWVDRSLNVPGASTTPPLLCGAGETLHAFVTVGSGDAFTHLTYAGGGWTQSPDTPPFAGGVDAILPGLAAYEGCLVAVGTKAVGACAQAWVYVG